MSKHSSVCYYAFSLPGRPDGGSQVKNSLLHKRNFLLGLEKAAGLE